MAKSFAGASWRLDVQQNWIDTTCGVDTIDPEWRGTDSNGHEHRYERGILNYPTLDYIVDAEHWCDGTEGIALHDPHMAVDESHYECKTCREVVEPGVIPAYTPSSIPGSRSYTLSGISPTHHVEVTMTPTEAEVERINAAAEDERSGVVGRILDNAPTERVTSMRSL